MRCERSEACSLFWVGFTFRRVWGTHLFLIGALSHLKQKCVQCLSKRNPCMKTRLGYLGSVATRQLCDPTLAWDFGAYRLYSREVVKFCGVCVCRAPLSLQVLSCVCAQAWRDRWQERSIDEVCPCHVACFSESMLCRFWCACGLSGRWVVKFCNCVGKGPLQILSCVCARA